MKRLKNINIFDQAKLKIKKITKEAVRKFALDMLFVCAGCAISAFAIIGILIPNGLTSGGVTGIVRIIQEILPFINFSVAYYMGALIILVACFFLLGHGEARKIVLLSLLYPAFLVLFENLNINLLEEKDIILAAIYVGVFLGAGTGLIFSRGFSSGGSDTVAKIIQKKLFPFVSLSKIMLIIDACVIIASGLIFGRNIALYALISQVILTKVIEIILYGFDSKIMQVEIISSEHDAIAQYILHEISRGVTNVTITGEYTKEEKRKIVTVCSPRESMLIKDFVAKTDRQAFVSVVRVEAVWGRGEGFTGFDDVATKSDGNLTSNKGGVEYEDTNQGH